MCSRVSFWAVAILAGTALAAPAVAAGAKEKMAAEVARIAALEARGDPVQCLMMADIQESRPVGTSMILVRQGAAIWYRNRLKQECVGMRPDRILTYRTAGSLVCRGDAMNVVDPVSRIQVGPCILGDFEPVESPFASRGGD